MHFTTFLHQVPFFRITLALILGFILSLLLPFWWIGLLLFGSAFLSFIFSLFLRDTTRTFHYRWLSGLTIILLFCGLGFYLLQAKDKNISIEVPEREQSFLAIIKETPREKPKSVMLVTKLYPNDGAHPFDAILYLQKNSEASALLLEDQLLVHAKMQRVRNNGNPYEFDYKNYLQRKGIIATAYIKSGYWEKMSAEKPFSIKYQAAEVRNILLNIYREHKITNNEFAVIAALTLGYTDELSQEIKQSFSISGGSHVLSVSGLHVGIIYLALGFFLRFMDRKKSTLIIKQIIILISLWYYTFICGLAPSIVRSAIMISLICISDIVNRKSVTYNAVFFSAFCMLIYNPYYVFDVGFQLSYMAVLSILFFQKMLYDLITVNNKVLDWLWSLTCVSIAAQIGTAPISLYYFHQFPSYFLLTNIVIIPATSIILYLAMALLAFSSFDFISSILTKILIFSTNAVNSFTSYIEHLSHSSVQGIYIELWQVICLFIFVIFIYKFINSKKSKYILVCLSTCILWLGLDITNEYKQLQKTSLIIYSNNRKAGFNLHYISGKENIIFTEAKNAETIIKTATPYIQKNDLNKPLVNIIESTNHFGQVFDKTYFVLQTPIKQVKPSKPISIDYLLVYSDKVYSLKQMGLLFNPKLVILGENIKGKKLAKIKEECNNMGVNYHSINENGAFICEQ